MEIRRGPRLQVMMQVVFWKPKYSMQMYAMKVDGQECTFQLVLISDNMVTGIMPLHRLLRQRPFFPLKIQELVLSPMSLWKFI
jgi:hypothetical protein